jgi:hypothetical protein
MKLSKNIRILEIWKYSSNNRLVLYIMIFKNKVSSVSIAPNIRTISSLFEDFSGLYIPDDLYLLINFISL